MRQYLLSGACAATMLLALTPAAQAADVEMVPAPGWSWYVSVFGGWSHGQDMDDDVNSSGTIYALDLELDDGFTAGVALGAHINEWLRGEIEVSGNWHEAEGVIATTAATPATTPVSGDVDALFVLANLWFEVPLGMGPFRPYAGGGVGFGRLDMDLNSALVTGSSVFDDDDWGFAWQLGVGVAFDVSANMAIDVGYRYKRIENAEIEPSTPFWATTVPDLEVDYASHNIIAGIRFSF
jgi:opacity protein-like surface antigen